MTHILTTIPPQSVDSHAWHLQMLLLNIILINVCVFYCMESKYVENNTNVTLVVNQKFFFFCQQSWPGMTYKQLEASLLSIIKWTKTKQNKTPSILIQILWKQCWCDHLSEHGQLHASMQSTSQLSIYLLLWRQVVCMCVFMCMPVHICAIQFLSRQS